MIMERFLIKTKEIGNHRIKIYYDSNAYCPCVDWDLACLYLFEYNDNCHRLHSECNWEKAGVGKRDTLNDALMKLARDYVSTKNLIKFFKKEVDGYFLSYNNSSKMWELKAKAWNRDEWYVLHEFDSPYLHNGGYNYEMLDLLDNEVLIELIDKYGEDIFIREWDTIGYSQGDYVSGVAYCTKERYVKMCNEDTINWKEKADKHVDNEVKCIGMWMWGDVKGFVLEEKVEFTKHFKDGREPEEDFEYKEIDSCWGYFMETDELIKEVIAMHNLKEEEAA